MAFLPALLFGSAATATTAATTGLFGAGGSFALGTTLGTVGTGLGVIGAIQGGKAEAGAAQYNADAARAEAQSRETAQRAAAQRQLASIRAGVAKSGAMMAGTPLAVLSESAANAEIDALNTRYSGQREAALYESRGRNARTAGYLRAGTSLLSSAGKYF
jgi:hypothetical protein